MNYPEEICIIFPHQIFEDSPLFDKSDFFVLTEEYLFFSQYKFHKQKIAFHRGSMKFYADFLSDKAKYVDYIQSHDEKSDIRKLIPFLYENGVKKIHYIDPVDDWLNVRIKEAAEKLNMDYKVYDSPLFINSADEISDYFSGKKKFRQTDFYIFQRKTRGIMLDSDNSPRGGKWTYDTQNRAKYPSKKATPAYKIPLKNKYHEEAENYVRKYFRDNYGSTGKMRYPVTFRHSTEHFEQFLKHRFSAYGKYQDAMLEGENFLHHSVISPLLNTGLLTPEYVIRRSIEFASENNIPLNSLEGFVRQILGWREFLRGIYQVKGRYQRSKNHFDLRRKIPESFYSGETGIRPVDDVIEKLNKTAYAHHIERLMLLGNFMLLCEFDPDEVYKWFMELFIDSYDWVMVPNVYGMSQYADGGLMAGKPYISSSNYIRKMSNYPKGEWQEIWDGLFWRFMDKYRHVIQKNPRLAMLIKNFDKMDKNKKDKLLSSAENYLDSISN